MHVPADSGAAVETFDFLARGVATRPAAADAHRVGKGGGKGGQPFAAVVAVAGDAAGEDEVDVARRVGRGGDGLGEDGHPLGAWKVAMVEVGRGEVAVEGVVVGVGDGLDEVGVVLGVVEAGEHRPAAESAHEVGVEHGAVVVPQHVGVGAELLDPAIEREQGGVAEAPALVELLPGNAALAAGQRQRTRAHVEPGGREGRDPGIPAVVALDVREVREEDLHDPRRRRRSRSSSRWASTPGRPASRHARMRRLA